MLLIAAQASQAQKTFYGTVEYDYQIQGENAEMMASFMPEKMVVKYGKAGILTTMEGGMMAAMMGKIVVNNNTGKAFVIKDDTKTVYIMSEEDMETGDTPTDPEITDLGETEEILGYTCKKYKMISETAGMKQEQYIWATNKLKIPEYKNLPKQDLTGSNLMAAGLEGFPLKVEMAIPETEMTLTLLVTLLEEEKISDDLFEAPSDYEEKPYSEFMNMGMGQ